MSKLKNEIKAMIKEMKTDRQACQETTFLGSFRPKRTRTRVLSAGTKGISQKMSFILSFHGAYLFGFYRFLLPEDEKNDGQADGRLGRGDRDDEKDDDLCVHEMMGFGQGDEGQVGGIEHDLDRQELGDQVPLDEKGDDAQDEENDAEDEEIAGRDHSFSLFFTRTMAPTKAAMMRTEVISKG